MDVRESTLGTLPCLVAGSGPPLVMLAGLTPEAGVSAGSLRRMHEAAMGPWAQEREVFYVNRRPGLPRGMTMAALAAEHARGLRETFDEPVDVMGASTGGSVAQQLAAEHHDVVRRLVLVSTGCRLGPSAKLVQRQIAARVRAGATRQAAAVMAGARPDPRARRPTLAPARLPTRGLLRRRRAAPTAEDAQPRQPRRRPAARSLTVSGAPFSYTIGAGDNIDASLPNPGKFDLSLLCPNGFFRHFAGSGAPALRVDVDSDHGSGRVRIRLRPPSGRGGHHESVVQVADAFGPDRTLRLHGNGELIVDTNHSGGWSDIALTTPSDPSFSYQLAGRLESVGRLTSDPQLGRS